MNKLYTHLKSIKVLYSRSLLIVLINTIISYCFGTIFIYAPESSFES